MKERFEKVKKFYRDHEEAILVLTGATVGALAVSYASTKATLNGLSIDHVEVNKDRDVRIMFKNGDIQYYNKKTPD